MVPPGLLRALDAPPVEQLSWPAIRLLLLPAFHTEVLLTITGDEEISRVEWRIAPWTVDSAHTRHYGPVQTDEHRASGELLSRVLESANQIRQVQLGQEEFLDGIGFVLWVRESSDEWVFAEHAWHRGITPILAGIIESCWGNDVGAEVNSAIAAAGEYVGLKLPTKPVPERPVRTGIGMLGEPAEVQGLAEALQERRPAKRPG